jgi:hypothetical protein
MSFQGNFFLVLGFPQEWPPVRRVLLLKAICSEGIVLVTAASDGELAVLSASVSGDTVFKQFQRTIVAPGGNVLLELAWHGQEISLILNAVELQVDATLSLAYASSP